MVSPTHTCDCDGDTTVVAWPGTEEILPELLAWAGERRWFPLKSGPVPAPEQVRVLVDDEIADGVRTLILALPGAEAGSAVMLHVPLVSAVPQALRALTGPGEAAGAAGFVLGEGDQAVALVDGPHHPAYWRAWAQAALDAGSVLDEQAARAVVERAHRLRVTTGEQSNTSVILPAPTANQGAAPVAEPTTASAGEADAATADLIVKVFRVLAGGRNPDVEVSVALARDGWDRVRRPVAWSTLTLTDPASGQVVSVDAAVGTTFIPRATDGFELFCSLAREDDGETGPVRARALALAEDLGRTTAQMHDHLAASLGLHEPAAPTLLRRSLAERAAWALEAVPALAAQVPGLSRTIETVHAELDALDSLEPATRVHGDYHLGQTLHEDGGEGRWFVLDFEGEPLRPLAQRCEPDQPLRDLAGMLRSMDYAAAVGRAQDPTWRTAVRLALLTGYRSVRSSATAAGAHRAEVLLTALELDKALYEAVYEARNRPDWLHIPLTGLTTLVEQVTGRDNGTKSPATRD